MWLSPEMNTILSTIKRIVESSLKAIDIEFPHANPEHEVYQKARKLLAVNYRLLVNQHFVDIKTLQNTHSFQQ